MQILIYIYFCSNCLIFFHPKFYFLPLIFFYFTKTESVDVKTYCFKMVLYWSDQIMKVLAVEKGLCAQHILENSTNLHYFVALGTV